MRFPLSLLAPGLLASSALASTPLQNHANNFKKRMDAANRRQAERPVPVEQPVLSRRESPYLTDKTREFAVNGTGIPSVPFDIGESYAGL